MLWRHRIRMKRNLKILQWEVEKSKARKRLRIRCLLMMKRSNRSNAGLEWNATVRTAIGVSIKQLMENHPQLSLALKKFETLLKTPVIHLIQHLLINLNAILDQALCQSAKHQL